MADTAIAPMIQLMKGVMSATATWMQMPRPTRARAIFQMMSDQCFIPLLLFNRGEGHNLLDHLIDVSQ